MLNSLAISNYALIKSVEMSPARSLNVITGETGAGKSILLGAIGLLLGNRADTKVLLDTSSKCIIEGEFDISEYQLKDFMNAMDLDYFANTIIRREITPSGKSRAFVNDSPVKLDTLRNLGSHLMDIHSQSDTLLLGQPMYQLNLIDTFGGTSDLLAKYTACFQQYERTRLSLEELVEKSAHLSKEEDYNHFLMKELMDAALETNEQSQLEEELKVLENAEEIKNRLTEALQILDEENYGMLQGIRELKSRLTSLRDFGEKFDDLSKRIESISIEAQELSRDLSFEADTVSLNPSRLEEVRDRLSLIFTLQQKHRVSSIQDLLAIQAKLEQDLQVVHGLDDQINDLSEKKDHLFKTLNLLGDELSQARQTHFSLFMELLTHLLKEVGIPEAEVRIKHRSIEPSAFGKDHLSIFFSANKGYAPAPLQEVASGGEFARLMFCIKYLIADKTALPTIIFDEIDTGVSGEISIKLGDLMKRMAGNHQVIAITHLPQIAAKGTHHYLVSKDSNETRSMSTMKLLDEEKRVEEIAKMLGGDRPTATALANARELMAI